MKVEGFLVIGAKKRHSWYDASGVRFTKKKPNTKASEIAIKLDIDVPDTLFERPQLEASIVIDDDQVSTPVITADVMDNIAETLSEQMGVKVNITAEMNE